jgi:hypothetical protein
VSAFLSTQRDLNEERRAGAAKNNINCKKYANKKGHPDFGCPFQL